MDYKGIKISNVFDVMEVYNFILGEHTVADHPMTDDILDDVYKEWIKIAIEFLGAETYE